MEDTEPSHLSTLSTVIIGFGSDDLAVRLRNPDFCAYRGLNRGSSRTDLNAQLHIHVGLLSFDYFCQMSVTRKLYA